MKWSQHSKLKDFYSFGEGTAGSLLSMIGVGIGAVGAFFAAVLVVLAASMVIFGALCFVIGLLGTMVVPSVLIPARQFDDSFKGAVCRFEGVVSVTTGSTTLYYPEFTVFRRGQNLGTGIPFKKCDGGYKCQRDYDGETRCRRQLKHVECDNFEASQSQVGGLVSWNNGEYQLGQNYTCEKVSDLNRADDELGCTSWSDMCVMMDRSKVPGAVSDEAFEGLMWGLVYGPLLAGPGMCLLAAITVLAAFSLVIVFALLAAPFVLCGMACSTAEQGVADYLDDEEKPQEEESLPSMLENGEAPEIVKTDV